MRRRMPWKETQEVIREVTWLRKIEFRDVSILFASGTGTDCVQQHQRR